MAVALPQGVDEKLSEEDTDTVDDPVAASVVETVADTSGVGDTDAAPRIDAVEALEALLVALKRAVADEHALALTVPLLLRLTTPLLVGVTVDDGDVVTHAVVVRSIVALVHAEMLDVSVELIDPLFDTVVVEQGVGEAEATAMVADAQVDAEGVRLPATLRLAVAHELQKSLPVELAVALMAVDGDTGAVVETDNVVESLGLTVPLIDVETDAQRDGDTVVHPEPDPEFAVDPEGLGVLVEDPLPVGLEDRVAVAQAVLLLDTLEQPDGVRVAHSVGDALGLPLELRVTPANRPPVELTVPEDVTETSALPLKLGAEVALAHALEKRVAVDDGHADSVRDPVEHAVPDPRAVNVGLPREDCVAVSRAVELVATLMEKLVVSVTPPPPNPASPGVPLEREVGDGGAPDPLETELALATALALAVALLSLEGEVDDVDEGESESDSVPLRVSLAHPDIVGNTDGLREPIAEPVADAGRVLETQFEPLRVGEAGVVIDVDAECVAVAVTGLLLDAVIEADADGHDEIVADGDRLAESVGDSETVADIVLAPTPASPPPDAVAETHAVALVVTDALTHVDTLCDREIVFDTLPHTVTVADGSKTL